MTINTKYNIGDIVYLKTDPDQLQRMVVSIWISPTAVMYELAQANTESDHHEIEISSKCDYSKKLGLEEKEVI